MILRYLHIIVNFLFLYYWCYIYRFLEVDMYEEHIIKNAIDIYDGWQNIVYGHYH